MIYRYSKADRALIAEVAKQEGVDVLLLGEMYEKIMDSNFWQDLHDIARENFNELQLKGE